ncbi:Hypothetical protein FKW44_014467 [Caligus rogercresseyi]|uniref:Uncharacterized protein n=1 Tax=Caligus rogercresseyi TaxID=217165 RepID=A0A7T8K0G0_CALRO|nr:Hypothetical protein FKW44_014467 [Caligus rogercresseyi]
MAAYLKAKEDGPLITLEVMGIAEKIRGNPSQAEEIKAGEEETLLELKNSISALNARWAKFCGKPQVLQELKDALQALNAAGKTPSKARLHGN